MESITVYLAACPYCGGSHGPRCPEVRALEYRPDGTIKRVEFVTPADYLSVPMRAYETPVQPWAPFPDISRGSGSIAAVATGIPYN